MRFYRPEVDNKQTHKLSGDMQRALQAWFESGGAPAIGCRKSGELTTLA
jgi:hypothetical protein